MHKIIECIPNFSEGRDKKIIDKIVDAIDAASDVYIADFSMDADHNRSVVTFYGSPESVKKSIIAAAYKAVELIDLNNHSGEHPRIGAIDVVPFVPFNEATMQDAVELSYQVGAYFADKIGIPVYYYEQSAKSPDRLHLANIRRGGFEKLRTTIKEPQKIPDAGRPQIHPTAGASAVGARKVLIAFNVNLNTNNMDVAEKIASQIRNLRETKLDLSGVKAISVYLKSRDIAQVSTNITDTQNSNVFTVYDTIKGLAKFYGVEILESELIGAITLSDVLNAQKHALNLNELHRNQILEF